MDTRTSPARLRIERIQDALRAQGAAAVVMPSSDPHLSEYLPERWQARQWASGFTGSMATLVVTPERPRSSPTAATGCRPRRSSPAAGSSSCASRRRRRRSTSTGCARTSAPAPPSPSTAACSGWRPRGRCATDARTLRHRPAQRPRRRSPPPGPIGRRCRRARSTSMPAPRRRIRARPRSRRCARRWPTRARRTT